MKTLALALACLLLTCPTVLVAQQDASISGRIQDNDTREGLAMATVSIAGTSITTITDQNGRFRIGSLMPGTLKLLVSHVGYITREISTDLVSGTNNEITILLSSNAINGQEIVVSAARKPEKRTFAPASIQVITAKDISRFPGSNANEMFSVIQGLEYNRSGVDEINVNARGLNSVFNIKVFQLVDGRNSMAPASAGVALFNNGTLQKDDIAQMEIVLGPQSALYGPNAHNALFNVISKDPRKYQGTTVSMSAGSQGQYSGRIRYAKMINEKWAYKITGELAGGREFEWYDSVFAGNQPPPAWTGDPNKPPPGNTPFYGPPVTIKERTPDLNFKRYRGEAHLYYSPSSSSDIIVTAGGSSFTRLQLTTSGHNQLKDVRYGFVQARYSRPGFFANIYQSWIDLGSVLNIQNYTRDYWNSTHDTRRPLPPDSAELFATRPGNVVTEKSGRFNAELQYSHLFIKAGLNLVAGASLQIDRPNSNGLTLIDSFQRIQVMQSGGVLQLDKKLPFNLRLLATTRIDHHNYLGTYVTPRFALLKNWENRQLRFSWGRALAMPSIQQQFAAINRVLFGNGGGIRYITSNSYIYDTLSTIRLKPEMVNTWELGYRGSIGEKFFVDINCYYGTSVNFISPPRTVPGRITYVDDVRVYPSNAGTVTRDTLRGGSFFTYFNYGTIRTYGIDVGVDYRFSRHLSSSIRYSWFGSDITEDKPENDANKDGYTSLEERSLNTPRNRGVLTIRANDIFRNKWSLSATARFIQQYDFYSGNQIGTAEGEGAKGIVYGGKAPNGLDRWYSRNYNWGALGGFTSIDLTANHKMGKHTQLNIGITNLLNSRQLEAVASPSIGRLFMVELKVHIDATE